MNTNLLQITTIPIKIEIKVTNATYEYPDDRLPKINISTQSGGFTMHSEPQKLKIDTYEARKSLGYGHMNDADMIKQKASEGISRAFQGTSRVSAEGDMLARGMKASEIAIQNAKAGGIMKTQMEFIPKEGADISFESGSLDIEYQMGSQEIDWDVTPQLPMEFVPGRVEFIVHDRPRVEIEYIGDPIYFPPSANPNYEPPLIDIKV